MREPVFKVSDQVRHKPGYTATGDGFGFRKWRDCTIYLAENKGSYQLRVMITSEQLQMNCAIVFASCKMTRLKFAKYNMQKMPYQINKLK